jgi:hypothetical protein
VEVSKIVGIQILLEVMLAVWQFFSSQISRLEISRLAEVKKLVVKLLAK